MLIPNLEISQFRGIKYANITDLGGRINLFIGRNNCGKSTVLDALYMLFAGVYPRITVDINGYREHIVNNFQDTVAVNFYQLDFDNPIVIKSATSKNFQSVEFNPVYDNTTDLVIDAGIPTSDDNSRKVTGLRIYGQIGVNDVSRSYESLIIGTSREKNGLKKLSVNIQVPEKLDLDFEISYISAKTPFALELSAIESIIEYKEQYILIDALKMIDNRIVDIAILKNRIYIDLGLKKLMPVEVLGDGIRRTVNIITRMYKCRNGVLLVDEFDNGIHYSSMPIIWKAIILAAEKFNVQFFVTTHNIDSLKTLKDTAEDFSVEIQNEIRCIKLEHAENDNLIAYNYNFPEFSYAIEMEHEIR